MDVMPQGLLGLLLSAMLGATVTSMDAGLNKNVGIAIRSFYKPILRPEASEKHLLVAGKLCTLLFGAVIIGFALYINKIRDTNLFDFVNQLAAYLLMPLALPLIYGLFYKRTPGWSAWSTALVAGAATWGIGKVVTPEWFQQVTGWEKPLNGDERTYLKLGITTLGGTVIVGSIWFFFTSLFYSKAPREEQERIEGFFANLATPVDKHGVAGVQTSVYRLLGTMCLAYGVFILLLMAIPNPLSGRMAFFFVGGTFCVVGILLKRAGATPPAVVEARQLESSSNE
jgi:Na+/proline symporter